MRFFLLAVFLLLPDGISAQTPAERITPGSGESRPAGPEQDINLPEEMRIRLAIERAEGEHRKVLEDVKKMCDLSGAVAERFRTRGSLSQDELKQVGTIEKLAKRILSHAGGKEVEDKPAEAKSPSLSEAVEGLTAAAARVKESMTAQTRHVVSATVIANSNEVINLAQFIRRTLKQND